jgi:hypothetical protein
MTAYLYYNFEWHFDNPILILEKNWYNLWILNMEIDFYFRYNSRFQ